MLLIDSRINDIDGIINSTNERTCCLVFNYYHDTYDTLVSKIRFFNEKNRYIYDNFFYEEPPIPTQLDSSNNPCTPCDDFEMSDIQLLPSVLENEYLNAVANGETTSNTIWSCERPIVFFQRPRDFPLIPTFDETITDISNNTNIETTKKPLPVYINNLDSIYDIGITSGETLTSKLVFDTIGIIQHAGFIENGYKLLDHAPHYACIQNVLQRDPDLNSWSDFIGFITSVYSLSDGSASTPTDSVSLRTLDLMACALYSIPEWKYIIDTLSSQHQMTIRASLDNTGAYSSGGNWILEANATTNSSNEETVTTTNGTLLTNVYFTPDINNWKYVLGTYVDNRYTTLRFNNSMYVNRAYNSLYNLSGATNSFTIETWYYETTKSYNCTIVDKGNYNYLFQIRNQNITNPVGLSFYNLNMGWLYAESAVVPVQQWCHIAMTRSGSTYKFFINGVLKQTLTNTTSLYENNSTFAIGQQSPDSCNCNYMKSGCSLYNMRLWNVARTDSQIQMYRNVVLPNNTANLVANYMFTDGTGSVNDRTVNALHTTIQNYSSAQWVNATVEIPNIGFLISNGYSLRTYNSTPLNAVTHFGDMTYTDFSGVDFSGVNLSSANLTGSNFTNANFTNANLTGAAMINTTLTGAITTGSTISSAITSPSPVLYFDGVDDGIDVGVPTWSYSTQFRTTMTVECWFKTADTNNQKLFSTLVSRNSTGNVSAQSQFSLYMIPAGNITFGVTNTADSGAYHTTTGTYKDAMWHHIAVTYDANTGSKNMYIDGVIVRSDTVTAGLGLMSNNTTKKLAFGNDEYGIGGSTDRQFRGSLSDIRIWNVVRSATDISNNFRQRLIGNETGLVGYWKLNQGYGTGWASYSTAIDSTSNRANGTLVAAAFGSTPSGSWVLSSLVFQPRITNFILGPKNGAYSMADASFSFTDPSSNSLGAFSYSINSAAATITNSATATTKIVYTVSGASISIPTLTTYEFPEIASLTDWQIDISFTVTGGSGTWRALVGDMYNELNVNISRGWGIWVSSGNRIHWSWMNLTSEPATISVSLNTAYVLTVIQSSATSTITLSLLTVSSGTTQTGSFGTGGNPIGKGPVTIGGWRSYSGENFPGTISYVTVRVPTYQRIVTIVSSTGGTPATITATQNSFNDFRTENTPAILTTGPTTTVFSTVFTVPAKFYGDAPFALVPPTSNNTTGAFSYTSSNTNVATISGNILTIVGVGSSTITVSQAETLTYTANSATATFTVSYNPNQSNQDLSGINYSGLNLTSFNFTNSNLTNSNLTNTTLTNAILTTANLTNANLTSAGLTSASLNGAMITGANLTSAILTGAIVTGANLTNAILTGATITATNLTSANLSGATVTGANLTSAILTSATITGANLTNANLTNASLSGATITNANLTNTLIVGANLTGITFTDAQKIQLRKNADNVAANISQIALPPTLPPESIISIIPSLNLSDLKNITTINVLTPDSNSNVTVTPNNVEGFYVVSTNNSDVKINSNTYRSTGNGVVVDINGTPVSYIKIGTLLYKVYAGSIIGIPVDPDNYKVKTYGLGVMLTTIAIGSGNVGSTGPTGPVGINGIDGRTGATGVYGYQGKTGSTGPQGPPAFQGVTGMTGPMGITGANGYGPSGPTGATGAPGTNAAKGNTGATGARGATGITGSYGPQGLGGITGNTGSTGTIGATGPTGQSVVKGDTGVTGCGGVTGANIWNNVNNGGGIYYNLGRVGIQTLAANTQYLLDVSGNIKTTGVMNVSDYRIKNDITYLDETVSGNSIEREILSNQIRRLRPVMFQNCLRNYQWEYGFLAHEVQDVFPELVNGIKDMVGDYQAISYHQLFSICCEEIKSLNSRVERLEMKQKQKQKSNPTPK